MICSWPIYKEQIEASVLIQKDDFSPQTLGLLVNPLPVSQSITHIWEHDTNSSTSNHIYM